MGEPAEERATQMEPRRTPIWQDHERRITALEITMSNLSTEFKEVKEVINKGNEEANRKLDNINDQLFKEFFKKQGDNRMTRREIILTLLSTGGLLYAAFDTIGKFF